MTLNMLNKIVNVNSIPNAIYLIIIIKHTLIGTETVLKSSLVLSEVDDDESPEFNWLSGIFLLLDEDVTDSTDTLSSEI